MRHALRGDGTAWVLLSALLCLGAAVVTAISAYGATSAGAGAGAALAAAPIARLLDWQAALGLREPWRLWTCAWVHGSAAHLRVNLAGGAVVAFVGWRARLPPAAALAWLLAWPATQLLMAAIGSERLAAAMPHYFGLSGVLHAGVVVLGLSLAWPARASARPRRAASRADTALAATRASAAGRAHLAEGTWATAARRALTGWLVSPPHQPPGPAAGERPGRERWIGGAILAGTLVKVAFEAPWNLGPRASEALGIAVAPVAHACGVGAGLMAWAAVRLLGRPVRLDCRERPGR